MDGVERLAWSVERLAYRKDSLRSLPAATSASTASELCGELVEGRREKSEVLKKMRMKRRLTRRQLAVLDDLFGSDSSASEAGAGGILEKHGVSAADYRLWHSEEAFAEEYEARLAALGRQSRLLIARYASYAAAKLIALTESENQETARKACLDIIDRIQNTGDRIQNAGHRIQNDEELREGGCEGASLTPELAEKILESLADSR